MQLFSDLWSEGGLEERLRAAEPLVADGDDLSVRKLVALLQRGRGRRRPHLVLKVQSDVAQLLLDVSDDFSLRCGDTHTFSRGRRHRVMDTCGDVIPVVTKL